MMNQQLINKLTDDLKPVCPMCPYACFTRLLVVATLGGAALLFVIGLRPDLQDSLHTMMPYWKSGIFGLIGIGAMFTLCRLGLPGREIGWVGPALMTAGVAMLMAFGLGAIALAPDSHSLWDSVTATGNLYCFACVSALGLILMLTGFIAVRRFAYTRPALAGWLLGTASGAFGASAYAWHCMVGQTMYVVAWYSLPVILLGLLGFALGPRLLRL